MSVEDVSNFPYFPLRKLNQNQVCTCLLIEYSRRDTGKMKLTETKWTLKVSMLDICFLLSHLTFQLHLNHAGIQAIAINYFLPADLIETNERAVTSFSFRWKSLEQQKTLVLTAQNKCPREYTCASKMTNFLSPVFGHLDIYLERNKLVSHLCWDIVL